MKFRRAAWHGVVAAAFGMALTFVFPIAMGPLPDGMQTPVVAFELARSVSWLGWRQRVRSLQPAR